VRYHVGDALEGLAAVDGEVDVVYCDIDKAGYPAAWTAAAERLRIGGLFLCDNVLWDGRVAGLTPTARGDAGAAATEPRAAMAEARAAVTESRASKAESRAAVTDAIVAMTREVAQDPRYVSAINPVRDGVLVALRVA
jgi:predicted O-methyltransferase YrrM